jgi:hypothetical protein
MISIFIDNRLGKYKNEIKYSFDFIFRSLGYNHRFISSPDKLKPNDILLIYNLNEPTLEELKPIAGEYITFYIPADVKLYDYRALSPDKIRRYLREIKLLAMTPVLSERKCDTAAENICDEDISAGKINFDLVGNIFFHLAGLEAQIDNTRDSNDTFPDDASAFYNWRDIPFIDNLLWLLDSMIKEHSRSKKRCLVQKCTYPEAQQAVVLLTHSVDDLQKWDFNSIILSTVDDIVMLFTLKWPQLFRNVISKIKYLFTNYEMYWNFEEYNHLEREFGIKSTYFIAAETMADIDYSLDDTDLQEEINGILREGHEIGILATDDKLNRDDYVTRKQIMLHQIHKQEIGLRQMGYKVNEAIKDLHHKTSPRYGSSSAFTEVPGFKHGLSLPYYPWVTACQTTFLELPILYRDRYLKVNKYRYLQLEDAKHQIKKLFQNTLRSRGVFGLDFSVAGFTDIPYCKKLYEYILALIEASKVWITTGLELCAWWEKRSRVTVEQGDGEISLFFPDDIEHFVIQIFSDAKIGEISGIDAKVDGNMVKFANVKAGSFAVISVA